MNEIAKLTDAESLQIEAWCHALMDGVIAPTEHAALEGMLTTNATARAIYIKCMGLSASLQHYAGGSLALQQGTAKGRTVHRARWWLGAAAAALVAAGSVFWYHSDRSGDTISASNEDDTTDGVAMLASMVDCRWEQGAPAVGEAFSAGKTLHLLQGMAELTFDCGAHVMLQAPTTLELTSAWSATLKQGTLHANVPPEAIGFRVMNPEVDVVDLGTEFSVVTDTLGASEVFVHQGAVEISPNVKKATFNKQRKSVMREKEARRFAHGISSEVGDAERKWQALNRPVSLPTTWPTTQLKRWEWSEGKLTDLTLTHPDNVKFCEAPNGGGVRFNGAYAAQLTLPSAANEDAHTLALWVRIAADSPLADAPPFLSWRGAHGNKSALVEVGINDDPAYGSVGALALRVGNRKITCSRSLRDGAWHHVAVVLVKVSRPQGATDWQVRAFLDGQLEPRSGKGPAKKARGKYAPGFWLATGVDDPTEYFEGDIGGLSIADGVLPPLEIRKLRTTPAQ